MWADLEEEYGDRVEFYSVDRETEEGREFINDHGVPIGQPGFILYDASGEVTYAGLGPTRPAAVRDLVESVVPQ
ncbi:MAG: hypothetical protein F4Z77_09380 [Dehalococcoidia bacterium]|nr:hypothetical protein [Chloroflexota bacterium]MXW26482.1 hypothetical protein [Dehalococcoidia bacterium]MXY88379.1 hypothetical protein [Dehalococcoidia bacterium]MYA53553.1 hypothetical protein [Dehalococcoidia bacterium]